MGVRRFCCSSLGCTHSHFCCQSCKSKGCSSCVFKAMEQWVSQQSHILPDCDWQHITLPYPIGGDPCSTTTVLCSMFCAATQAMLRWIRKQGVEVGIFCALHTTVASSTNIRTFICPSLAAGSV
ncbi:transposase zinc-binding domain-containing protein [Enterobacter asburiae]|uniref:transposase zinc-binding domain-containing protein n=1 Tax=Enterobacter asburiae TaxID=61645 RepID=UPI00192C1E3C|nr:transposase zinc-binding domain-containing protein [Enterobacter asburiae]